MSKSAVSRRFVTLSQEQLSQWLSRSLGDVDLPVVMIDGIHFRDRVILVALGIDAKGNKHVLGLREGSTESTRVVRSLLSELIERGLDADRARLWVIDGGKALRRAIVECFGALALVQRCQEHKRRNVIEPCPRNCTPVWAARCVTPGAAPRPSSPGSNCSGWRRLCRPNTLARRPACARGWRKR